MIINKNISPQRDVYYLGALLINVLTDHTSEISFFEAFIQINQREKVSMNLFTLAVDWLFLLGAISSKDGRIVKCF
jgi:hypothetical protein